MKNIRILAALTLLCLFCTCIKEETTDFNFSISNPGIITLEPGKSKEIDIFVRGLSVDTQKVYLWVNGLPKGVTATIDSSKGTPGFYCKVRYSAATDAVVGVYPFEVLARSEKGNKKSYISEVNVITYASCVTRYSGPVSVSQDRDSVRFIYTAGISCKASDSGLFYIENFANRKLTVQAYFDCTQEIIEIPEQVLGTTIIRGSGRVMADSLCILATLQDGTDFQHIREFYGK